MKIPADASRWVWAPTCCVLSGAPPRVCGQSCTRPSWSRRNSAPRHAGARGGGGYVSRWALRAGFLGPSENCPWAGRSSVPAAGPLFSAPQPPARTPLPIEFIIADQTPDRSLVLPSDEPAPLRSAREHLSRPLALRLSSSVVSRCPPRPGPSTPSSSAPPEPILPLLAGFLPQGVAASAGGWPKVNRCTSPALFPGTALPERT